MDVRDVMTDKVLSVTADSSSAAGVIVPRPGKRALCPFFSAFRILLTALST